ncbi:hypothetical protein CJ20_070 [Escherichia phage CJ20]|nr:hypothetical protein CJ20_070 [Escherichia phage CJ20]
MVIILNPARNLYSYQQRKKAASNICSAAHSLIWKTFTQAQSRCTGISKNPTLVLIGFLLCVDKQVVRSGVHVRIRRYTS